jgi:hypothetical protein
MDENRLPREGRLKEAGPAKQIIVLPQLLVIRHWVNETAAWFCQALESLQVFFHCN